MDLGKGMQNGDLQVIGAGKTGDGKSWLSPWTKEGKQKTRGMKKVRRTALVEEDVIFSLHPLMNYFSVQLASLGRSGRPISFHP